MPRKKKLDTVFTWRPFTIHDPRLDVSKPLADYQASPLKDSTELFIETMQWKAAAIASGDNRRIAHAMKSLATSAIEWLSDASHFGNELAQQGLLQAGQRAGELCMLAARHKLPAIVKSAKASTCMPGLISNLPQLQQQAAQICDGVGLGKGTKFQADGAKKAKVVLANRVNVLALDLLKHINAVKNIGDVIGDYEAHFQRFEVDPLMESIVRLPKLTKTASVVNSWAAACMQIIERGDNYSPALMEYYRSDLLRAIKDALRKLAK